MNLGFSNYSEIQSDEKLKYINLVISDFKASSEATEVWAKLETFIGYSLTALKLMAEAIKRNFSATPKSQTVDVSESNLHQSYKISYANFNKTNSLFEVLQVVLSHRQGLWLLCQGRAELEDFFMLVEEILFVRIWCSRRDSQRYLMLDWNVNQHGNSFITVPRRKD
ncbi:hypothetical protein RCL_jg7967.t1 [Rhizophagus clarus]|uniref:Uncharacterized protein n=1 Tax=Rhizophagus clarus TaxID=94130 RepID=A0A8H3MFU7_9GLOM|nr:hypothetical protein RCL_jg7967.t1 [Rhizophagus clarus]